jgi:SsrA-binding protein
MKTEFYNKKARFDYEIIESMEAGIVLTGEEIKAIRTGRVSLVASYAKIISGEVFWLGGNFLGITVPDRTKKLLLNKSQIKSLIGKIQEGGMTLIPLKLYLKKGKAKLELGLGRGKKKYDKRESIKRHDQEREAARRIKV